MLRGWLSAVACTAAVLIGFPAHANECRFEPFNAQCDGALTPADVTRSATSLTIFNITYCDADVIPLGAVHLVFPHQTLFAPPPPAGTSGPQVGNMMFISPKGDVLLAHVTGTATYTSATQVSFTQRGFFIFGDGAFAHAMGWFEGQGDTDVSALTVSTTLTGFIWWCGH